MTANASDAPIDARADAADTPAIDTGAAFADRSAVDIHDDGAEAPAAGAGDVRDDEAEAPAAGVADAAADVLAPGARDEQASARARDAETEMAADDLFRGFYLAYGPTLCGEPLGGVVVENGVPTQYFRNLALEAPWPGHVRLKPLGAAWMELRAAEREAEGAPEAGCVDAVALLRRDPERRYPTRPLADIRYIVVHVTGGPPDMGPHPIADEHVTVNGWPGIGYHYVVTADGTVYRTQDLTTVSFHAAQFNPAAVGVALCGDGSTSPPPAQLAAAAALLGDLCAELGLAPAHAIRGHREMVPTACPGDLFLAEWKPGLVRAAETRLRRERDAGPRGADPAGPVESRSA